MKNANGLYEKALELAKKAHAGQYDKGGNPYIEHPLYVAAQMETTELKIIALLHDALEDSALTAEDLRQEGFPEEIVETICLLTHEDGTEEDYMSYIARVAESPRAAAVKMADLRHNMDLSRISRPTEKDLERCRKYRRALACLTENCGMTGSVRQPLENGSSKMAE